MSAAAEPISTRYASNSRYNSNHSKNTVNRRWKVSRNPILPYHSRSNLQWNNFPRILALSSLWWMHTTFSLGSIIAVDIHVWIAGESWEKSYLPMRYPEPSGEITNRSPFVLYYRFCIEYNSTRRLWGISQYMYYNRWQMCQLADLGFS